MTTPQKAYEKFYSHLSRYLFKRLNNQEDVEDVLQDVFVRVVCNEQALKQATNPLAWLYTVTRTALIDHYRKTANDQQNISHQRDVEEMPNLERPDDLAFPECLRPLVESLPAKYSQAISFTYLQDGNQRELAKHYKLNPATAKSRVQRGRKMLKDAILECCRVELDNQSNIIDVIPQNCKEKCC